jgi:hypothetical protein
MRPTRRAAPARNALRHACERVGWLFARSAIGPGTDLTTLAHDYMPIQDDWYLPDRSAGAVFDRSAIRAAMQHCLDTGDSAFHVHLHGHRGRPGFSRTDRTYLWPLIPPLQVTAGGVPHGILLLSLTHATCVTWPPGSTSPVPCEVRIVGYPMGLF